MCLHREETMTNIDEMSINAIRVLSADAIQKANSGHPGLPLGTAPTAYELWTNHMNYNPADPKWENRDRFVLSGGHGSMLLYSLFHLLGIGNLSLDDVKNFRQMGSKTPGHPEYGHTVGVEATTGPLGQGMAMAVGMAMAGKMDNADYRVYTMVGDGESEEGQVWEASMFAGFRKLDNLVVIVDNNNLQIDGAIDEVCSPYPFDKKFEAFNFHVIKINGHDFDEIRSALKEARETKGMPTAIIMNTVKGKGVSFMENQVSWHGSAPNEEQYNIAMEELEKAGEALCQK